MLALRRLAAAVLFAGWTCGGSAAIDVDPEAADDAGEELANGMPCLLQLALEISPLRQMAGTSAAGGTPFSKPPAASKALEVASKLATASREGDDIPYAVAPQRTANRTAALAAASKARKLKAGMAVNQSLFATAAGHSFSVGAIAGLKFGTAGQKGLLPTSSFGWIVFGVALLATVFLTCWGCSVCFSKSVELAIETYDTKILGVDVDIGTMLVNPLRGTVTIHGLKVHNPPGYTSEYLLTAKFLHVDFDTQSLVFSGFSKVDLEAIVVKSVDVIYEKTLSSSNVSDVLAFLGGDEEEKRMRRRRRRPRRTEDVDKMGVSVMKVLVQDVGMRLQGAIFCGHGPRLALADIQSEAFTKEVGGTYLDDVLKLLLRSVLKSVIANLVGQTATEKCY